MSIDNVMGVSTFSEVLGVSNPGKVMGVQDIYQIPTTIFNGSSSTLYRAAGLSGVSNGKVGTLSMWIKYNGGNGVRQDTFYNGTGFMMMRKSTANRIQIFGFNTTPTQNLFMESSGTITADGQYHHIFASWDVASGLRNLYIDGVNALGTNSSSNSNINYNTSDWVFLSFVGGGYSNATVGQIYLNLSEYVGPSDIGKFYNAGNPVSLGATGATPTGNSPIVFFNNDYATFGTNLGTGGNFTPTALADGGFYP